MAKQLQTIYEYLSDFTKKEIDEVISYDLNLDDKILLSYRYGDDLLNPVTNDGFNQELRKRFYNYLVPKMRRILLHKRNYRLDLKAQLLELIKLGTNNNEICKNLNLNEKQLYNLLLELKNNGMMMSRKYYSDGSIKYKRIYSLSDLKNDSALCDEKAIITDSKEDRVKFLVISDLHFGNTLERIDLVNRAYEYCVKNGINIILACGDLIDGSFTKGEQKISSLYEQIEYFIKNYPYDKNILTFSVAGDHDFSAIYRGSLNMTEMCNNYRHDVIIGGYGISGHGNIKINLKNDQILLRHPIDNTSFKNNNVPLVLQGHSHKYSTNFDIKKNQLYVTVPSLSDINHPMPSALELNLSFKKGYLAKGMIKQIYFGTQDIILNESIFDLLSNRTVNFESIRNIEPYKGQDSIDKKQLVRK